MDTPMAGTSPGSDAEPPDKPSATLPQSPLIASAVTAPSGSTMSMSPHDTTPSIDQHMEAQWCFTGTEDDLPLVGRLANGVEDIRRGMNACYSVAYEERTRRKEFQARALSLQSELDQEIAQRISAEGLIHELKQRNSYLQQELDKARLENEQLQRQLNGQTNAKSPDAQSVSKSGVSIPHALTPRSLQTRGSSSPARRSTLRRGSVRPSVPNFHQDTQSESRSQPTIELTSENYVAHMPAPGTQRMTIASLDQSLGSSPSSNSNPGFNGTQPRSVSSDSAYRSGSEHQGIKREPDDRGVSKCIFDVWSFDGEDEQPKPTNSISKNNSSSPILALESSSQDLAEIPNSPSASPLPNDTTRIEAYLLEQQQITELRQDAPRKKNARHAPKPIWALREAEHLEESGREESSELEEGEVVEGSEILTSCSLLTKPTTRLARPPWGNKAMRKLTGISDSVAQLLRFKAAESIYDPFATPIAASSPSERTPAAREWEEKVKARKVLEKKENEEYWAKKQARNPKVALAAKLEEERLARLAKLEKEDAEKTAEMEAEKVREAAREQAAKEKSQKEEAERQQALKDLASKQQAQKEEAERQQALRKEAERQQAQEKEAERQQAQKEAAELQLARKKQAKREQAEKRPVKREQTKLPSLNTQSLTRVVYTPPAKPQFGLDTTSALHDNRLEDSTRQTAHPAPKPSICCQKCGQELWSENALERHLQHCYSRNRPPPTQQAEKHQLSPPEYPPQKKVASEKLSQYPSSQPYRRSRAPPPPPSGPPPPPPPAPPAYRNTDSRKPSPYPASRPYGKGRAPPPPPGPPPPPPRGRPPRISWGEIQAQERQDAEMAEWEEARRREHRDKYDEWRR